MKGFRVVRESGRVDIDAGLSFEVIKNIKLLLLNFYSRLLFYV